MKMRKRPHQITFYIDDEEKINLKDRVEKVKKFSAISQSDFIRFAILQGDICIIENLKDVTLELKRIGNNLNQLTTLAHQKKVYNCKAELDQIQKELSETWQLLKQLKKQAI